MPGIRDFNCRKAQTRNDAEDAGMEIDPSPVSCLSESIRGEGRIARHNNTLPPGTSEIIPCEGFLQPFCYRKTINIF